MSACSTGFLMRRFFVCAGSSSPRYPATLPDSAFRSIQLVSNKEARFGSIKAMMLAAFSNRICITKGTSLLLACYCEIWLTGCLCICSAPTVSTQQSYVHVPMVNSLVTSSAFECKGLPKALLWHWIVESVVFKGLRLRVPVFKLLSLYLRRLLVSAGVATINENR